MKKNIFLPLLTLASAVSAHDFVADGLYFNITSTSTVAVTYEGGYPNGHYSGTVVVPQNVDYQGATYQVTAVTDYAFANCPALVSVELPVGVKSLGLSSFMQSTGLTRVLLPEGLEEIGMWSFQGCSALERIVIPEGVTALGEGALMQNPRLRYVNLPSTLTRLVQQLFYDDQGLDTLVLHTEAPPEVQNGTVLHQVPAALHVVVPCGCLDAYEGEPWSGYRVEENCGAIAPVEAAGAEGAATYFDLAGRRRGARLEALPPGLYIERQGGKGKKVYHLK